MGEASSAPPPQVITLNGLQRETAVLLSNCQVASIFLPGLIVRLRVQDRFRRANKAPSSDGTA